MTKEVQKRVVPEVKFTLEQALHRTLKKEILLDVVVAGEVVEDYPVGWVKIRGSQDPLYLKDVIPVYTLYREKLDEANNIKDVEEKRKYLQEITLDLHTSTVTVAILDWDEDFFGSKYTPEIALDLFKNESYTLIYNQVAEAMQKREDFLPVVSIPQENG